MYSYVVHDKMLQFALKFIQSVKAIFCPIHVDNVREVGLFCAQIWLSVCEVYEYTDNFISDTLIQV